MAGALITKVTEIRWTQSNGKMGFQYNVLYESGRRVCWNWQKNLPLSVLDFILADDVVAETRHLTDFDGKTTKITKYTKAN